jgi:hypothetical protein
MSYKSPEPTLEPKVTARCFRHGATSIGSDPLCSWPLCRDHSRRVRRMLDRVMTGHPTHVAVQPARYSSFDPDRWWETRDGIRTEIIELQKLVLEAVLHPMSF